MQTAFDLEDQGEVENPLPPSYARHEGRVVRLEQGGDTDGSETSPTPNDGFDVSQSFIGRAT